MQQTTIRSVRSAASVITIGAFLSLQPSCGTLDASQRGALLVGAEALANIAGTAAATYYGGPAAGQLASAGLSALGSVLQGYVGANVPSTIVEASPGVGNVGEALAGVIAPNRVVSQGDVTTIEKAAAIAATFTSPAGATGATGAASVSTK